MIPVLDRCHSRVSLTGVDYGKVTRTYLAIAGKGRFSFCMLEHASRSHWRTLRGLLAQVACLATLQDLSYSTNSTSQHFLLLLLLLFNPNNLLQGNNGVLTCVRRHVWLIFLCTRFAATLQQIFICPKTKQALTNCTRFPLGTRLNPLKILPLCSHHRNDT